MRYSTTAVVLAAMTIGEAVAGPTHVHKHRRAHQKKDLADVDWNAINYSDVDYSTIDWKDMSVAWGSDATSTSETAAATTAPAHAALAAATTEASSAVAVATSVSKAAATSTTSSSTGSLESDIASLWNDLVGLANDVKAFGASTSSSGSEISATGNIGNAQGSNMMKVSSATGYDFTSEFINTSGESMTVVIWNKAYSPDGTIESVQANMGSAVAPKTPILTLALAAGESQVVAFDTDSLVGWCQATSAIAASGAFAETWGEASFNPAASGYDVSAIMNANGNDYNMTITSVEAPQCSSTMTENMWLTDSDPVGNSDGSCYIAQNTATLTVTMGGKV